jgi:hypothetical protein
VRDPGYTALRGLWEKKRGSRRYPARKAFAPRELDLFRTHLMLLEVLPGPDFRYAQYGAGLAILFGRDLTDQTTTSLHPTERDPVLHDYVAALDGAPRFVTQERRTAGGRHRTVQKLILPLGDGEAQVDHLLVLVGLDPGKPD